MTNETAAEIFEACYCLLRTMHQDPPPNTNLNFSAGVCMGMIAKTMFEYRKSIGEVDADGNVHDLFPS